MTAPTLKDFFTAVSRECDLRDHMIRMNVEIGMPAANIEPLRREKAVWEALARVISTLQWNEDSFRAWYERHRIDVVEDQDA